MSGWSKGRLLTVCAIWLCILGAGAMVFRWIVVPAEKAAEQHVKEERQKKILTETGASSRYDHSIRFAFDAFSGYAVYRSQEFSNELARKKIKVELVDDGADYIDRLKALASGDIQMAAFTVDALIKASYEIGELPATVVAITDETRGADAMVAYKEAIPNLDALNNSDTKFVIIPNSPSETLARVVIAHFHLDNLSADPFIKVTGDNPAQEVYKRYRIAKPEDRQVFVLWQPYVSKILENPNTHVVIDSGRFKGYIVDVIVVNRDFLYANHDVVSEFIESYFRAAYSHREKMIKLVSEDARRAGTPLTDKQATCLVDGVWWKNTLENYVHFGVQEGKLQHIEDIISNITKVLVKTGGISKDPTDGKPNMLYYMKILSELKANDFHPGIDEKIRDDTTILPALTDAQWEKLLPVGTLHVPTLVFARGTARLSGRSHKTLDALIKKLETWPQYYVSIKGNASLRGNLDANKKLALARAKTAEKYLVEHGVAKNRVRACSIEPTGKTSVDFILGQTPY